VIPPWIESQQIPTQTNPACSTQKQKVDKKSLKTREEFTIYNTIKPTALQAIA